MNSPLTYSSPYPINTNPTFTLPEAIKTSAFSIQQQSNRSSADTFQPQTTQTSTTAKQKVVPWLWVAGLGVLTVGAVAFHKDIAKVWDNVSGSGLFTGSQVQDSTHSTATNAPETVASVKRKVSSEVHQ